MDPRKAMWIAAGVGSIIGGYVPTFWGASPFSFISFLGSAIGVGLGVWLVFKMSGY